MSADSLGAAYFEGIFRADPDPWRLASSDYEVAKFDASIAAIDDRRYVHVLEIGCAHGVLTKRLAGLCDALLAIDISETALARAAAQLEGRANVRFERMAFPRETPADQAFDLIVASEVVYYWSDADIAAAGRWLSRALVPGGRLLLVHWLGETDYPQTGDGAVERLRHETSVLAIERESRTPDYRLDLWRRADIDEPMPDVARTATADRRRRPDSDETPASRV